MVIEAGRDFEVARDIVMDGLRLEREGDPLGAGDLYYASIRRYPTCNACFLLGRIFEEAGIEEAAAESMIMALLISGDSRSAGAADLPLIH